MIRPILALSSVVIDDVVSMAIVGALLLGPQVLGYFVFRWWSRLQRSGARLLGMVVPPLSIALPYVIVYIGVWFPEGASNPESFDYDPISPLIGILAGIHFGAAVVAHGVGALLEPPIDDVRVTPAIKARRPN